MCYILAAPADSNNYITQNSLPPKLVHRAKNRPRVGNIAACKWLVKITRHLVFKIQQNKGSCKEKDWLHNDQKVYSNSMVHLLKHNTWAIENYLLFLYSPFRLNAIDQVGTFHAMDCKSWNELLFKWCLFSDGLSDDTQLTVGQSNSRNAPRTWVGTRSVVWLWAKRLLRKLLTRHNFIHFAFKNLQSLHVTGLTLVILGSKRFPREFV